MAMRSYNLMRTWRGTGESVRYYVDGKRVTRWHYDNLNTLARRQGSQDCYAGIAENRHGRSAALHSVRVPVIEVRL